jgi:cysteinyl-tRNA synthetase
VFGVLAHDSSQTLLALRRQIAAQQGVDEGWVVERIAARRLAREARDYAASDAIRDELTARGVEIMDTPSGTEWDMAPRSDSADAEAT